MNKKSEWSEIMREYEQVKGLVSQVGFCSERGIPIHRFKYYRSLLKKEALSSEAGDGNLGHFVEAGIEEKGIGKSLVCPKDSPSSDLRLQMM